MVVCNWTTPPILLLLLLQLANLVSSETPGGLTHPGGLHTVADIARIRSKLAAGLEPWTSAYKAILDQGADYNTAPQAKALVLRGGDTNETGLGNMKTDSTAVYLLMVKWMASNDSRYGDAAIRILDAWSETLKTLSGFDARLAAGIYGNKFAQAAELAAYYNPIWPNKARFQKMLMDIFYPIITIGGPYGWSTSCMVGMMSIAVFCDNKTMFDRVVNAYKNGEDSPTNFPWNPKFGVTSDGLHSLLQYVDGSGQVGEAGRDDGHSHLAMGQYMSVAVNAYNQGVNLFQLGNERLKAGFEYIAAWHLNKPVPYKVYKDEVANNLVGIWTSTTIANNSGANFPIYEMALAYFERNGMSAPNTKEVVYSKGYAPETWNNLDHTGIGTLTMRQ